MLICCLGMALGTSTLAQEPASTLPGAKQEIVSPGRLLAADLEVLSKRWGVAFVAEGTPIPVMTKALPVPSLSEKLSQEEAVREVADYFDYAVTRQGSTYLLAKRYSSVYDLPDLTPEECMAGLKVVARQFARFNPHIPPPTYVSDPMAKIGEMLSASQFQKLSDGGLAVSDLTPEQQAEVRRLALSFYIQSPADPLEKLYDTLVTRNPADPVFRWQNVQGTTAFGYSTRSVLKNDLVFVTVSNSDHIAALPDGTIIKHSLTDRNGKPEITHDPTDPDRLPEEIKAFMDDQGKSTQAVTLSDAVGALGGQAADHKAYQVDPMYARKHVTLVGADRLAPDVLMSALAKLYGLRIVHTEDGATLLTHPVFGEAAQLSGLGDALLTAIPKPLLTLLRNRDAVKAMKAAVKAKLEAGRELTEEDMTIWVSGDGNRMGLFLASAMRMFRYAAERAVKAQPGEKLTLSRMDRQTRDRFAFYEMAGSFSMAVQMADRPVPLYVSDMDHVVLNGGLSHDALGRPALSLFLSYHDPKTGERSGPRVGFGNATLPTSK